MRNRSFVVTALAATLLIGACRSDPPPPPAPTGPTQAELDSIAAAEAEREAARVAREREAAAEAARREAAAAAAELERARDALTAEVYFDYDMSEIRADAQRILRSKVEILRASPRVNLQVAGHADERGSNEYNIALGNRRAQAVVDFFTNFGIDADRFTVISYGEERPAAQGSTERSWAQNRRAEFNITAGRDAINTGRTP